MSHNNAKNTVFFRTTPQFCSFYASLPQVRTMNTTCIMPIMTYINNNNNNSNNNNKDNSNNNLGKGNEENCDNVLSNRLTGNYCIEVKRF